MRINIKFSYENPQFGNGIQRPEDTKSQYSGYVQDFVD